MQQGMIDGYGVLLVACTLLLLSLWMRRNGSIGFALSQKEINNLIAKDVDVDQVIEYLHSANSSSNICLFIENKNNKHIFQLSNDSTQEFFVSLCDKRKHWYRLASPNRIVNKRMGFTLKQVSGVVEDYFHSKNLLKDNKYV